jgi:hypothetical protein
MHRVYVELLQVRFFQEKESNKASSEVQSLSWNGLNQSTFIGFIGRFITLQIIKEPV